MESEKMTLHQDEEYLREVFFKIYAQISVLYSAAKTDGAMECMFQLMLEDIRAGLFTIDEFRDGVKKVVRQSKFFPAYSDIYTVVMEPKEAIKKERYEKRWRELGSLVEIQDPVLYTAGVASGIKNDLKKSGGNYYEVDALKERFFKNLNLIENGHMELVYPPELCNPQSVSYIIDEKSAEKMLKSIAKTLRG